MPSISSHLFVELCGLFAPQFLFCLPNHDRITSISTAARRAGLPLAPPLFHYPIRMNGLSQDKPADNFRKKREESKLLNRGKAEKRFYSNKLGHITIGDCVANAPVERVACVSSSSRVQ